MPIKDLLVFEEKGFFLVLLYKGGQFEFTKRIDVNSWKLNCVLRSAVKAQSSNKTITFYSRKKGQKQAVHTTIFQATIFEYLLKV